MSDDGWVDVSHELPKAGSNDGWQDVSHELSAPTESWGKSLARSAIDTIPVAGMVGGGAVGTLGGIPTGPGAVATGMLGAGLGYAGGNVIAKILKHQLLGDADPSQGTYLEQLKDTGSDVLTGTAMEGGGRALGELLPVAAKYAGTKLRGTAGSLAENATGATGKQASKFADGAGNELLDRGMVRFGDSPANVAARTEAGMSAASGDIDSSLKALDAKGVTASADNVVADLQSKIAQLKKDPSQAPIVRKLQSIVDDIMETGASSVPISEGETTKRGYRKAAGNWMDPEAGQAGKEAYLSYMNEVEGAATKADPALANKFIEGKKTFGLLAPIQEAAERRASTLNQSPWAGLLDTAATAATAPVVGVPMAIAGSVGRKLIAPRLSSSAAVTANSISKLLLNSPRMQALASANPAAFQALASQLETRASSAPSFLKAADNNDPQNSKTLDMFSQNPDLINNVKDPELKQQIQKHLDKNKAPKEAFLDGN